MGFAIHPALFSEHSNIDNIEMGAESGKLKNLAVVLKLVQVEIIKPSVSMFCS